MNVLTVEKNSRNGLTSSITSAMNALTRIGKKVSCKIVKPKKMIVFDLFSGTGSATKPFSDAGHTVYTFEMSEKFDATEHVDVMDLTADYLLKKYGRPDFIWASPPCTAFSVASIWYHWTGGDGAYIPKTDSAVYNQELVAHTRKLIEQLKPKYGYVIENPRGMLRKLPPVQGLPRQTVSYCQYGEDRMKPTDLWGAVPNWVAKPICKLRSPCHQSAPRGAWTGTNALRNATERSRVPYQLGKEILEAIERSK